MTDPDRFDPASLRDLDEPVRRYFEHALAPGAPLTGGRRLSMAGHIDVGRRLAFTAEQDLPGHGHAFTWRARAGLGRVRPLHVVDRYWPGGGLTEGRILGRIRFMHGDDANVARAAAGRAAAESMWDPPSLLPRHGVRWEAEADDLIVARFDVPPEAAELRLGIDDRGAVRTVSIMRWGDVGQDGFGPIPFGGDMLAERTFGDVTLPSEVRVGWWYGTPRYKPFFEATITDAQPLGQRPG